MMNFIPDKLHAQVMTIPYFEDQLDQKIPGRGTTKSCEKLQDEIRDLMKQLDAWKVAFLPGTFDEKPKRYGYRMTFMLEGEYGRMEIAALPIHWETDKKKDRALAQALYLIRNWLESEVFSQVYRPGAMPLVPYLIGPGGKTSVEIFVEKGQPILLPAGSG